MKKSLLRHLIRPIRSPKHHPHTLLHPHFVRRHSSEIMFGVLVVVFRGDRVATLSFRSGERQIPLIVSLRTGRVRRFGAGTRHPSL